MMRALEINEISIVAGGGDVADAAAVGGSIGGGVGLGLAQFYAVETIEAAAFATGMGAAGGAALFASGALGWEFGNWLNDNTPIQDWIRSGLDYFGF